MIDKTLIINKIKERYKFKSDTEFARHLDITPQVLSNWKTRNTFDPSLVYTKCLDINPEWLLTGKGEMLRKDDNISTKSDIDRNWIEEANRISKENCALKETNELLRFKIGVLEKELSEVKYTQRDLIIYGSVAETEPELIEKKSTKKDGKAKK
jgi:ribosomal protein S8E